MKRSTLLRILYGVGGLFSFQVALTTYLNASFLATKLPETLLGFVYTLSALLGLIGLWIIPYGVRRFGIRKVFLGVLTMTGSALVALISFPWIGGIIAACSIFLAGNTLIFFCIDILIETYSSAEQGTVRGIYLTLVNLGFMLAPVIGGFIVDRIGFHGLYIGALLILLPLALLIFYIVPSSQTVHRAHAHLLGSIATFMKKKDLGIIFLSNFVLQFFYAIMVIYSFSFLHTVRGIPWDTLGMMLTIALSAFVLFQYIVGKFLDRWHYHALIIGIGFALMGGATLGFTQAALLSIPFITFLLFLTRTGASMVEVATESYFFQQVHADDVGTIGFFRNTYPLAYTLAPIIASGVLEWFPFWALFTFLGILCCASIGLLLVMPSSKKVT